MGIPTGDVTSLLKAWNGGDREALPRLAECLYSELHRMAHRYMRNEHHADTLQTTVLINEAYLRLTDVAAIGARDRAQFFALASQVMRRILVDAARARAAGKRGGDASRLTLDDSAQLSNSPDPFVLALNDALTSFAQTAPRQAKVVELRYFGGLGEEEIAAALEIAPRTVRRDWEIARAWLLRELKQA